MPESKLRRHATSFMNNIGKEMGLPFGYDQPIPPGKERVDRGELTGYRVSRNTLTTYSGLDIHPDELREMPLGPNEREDLGVFFFPDRAKSYVATSFCWKPLRSGRVATDIYQHRVNRGLEGVTESEGISFEDDSALFFKPTGTRAWMNREETRNGAAANIDAFYDEDGQIIRVTCGIDSDGETDMVYLQLARDGGELVVDKAMQEGRKPLDAEHARRIGLDYPERVEESGGRYPFWMSVEDKEFQKPVQVRADPSLLMVKMSDWLTLGPEH